MTTDPSDQPPVGRPRDEPAGKMQVRGHETVAKFGSLMRVNLYKIRYPLLTGGLSDLIDRVDFYRGDAVAALLHRVTADGAHELIFVRQFRFSTTIDADTGAPDFARDGMILELMAGMRRPDEPWVECLRRETREETGYDLEAQELIGSFYPSPGACSEQIHLYYARLAPASEEIERQVGWGADKDEETERIVKSPRAFLDMVEAREIRDAKALVAAEWMRRPGNLAKFGLS